MHFGAVPPPGARRVGFDGTWLAGFERLLAARGRRQTVALGGEAPRVARPEESVERALDLPNATWRLAGVGPAVARVLVLRCAYTATSDDRRAGLLDVAVNVTTRSTMGGLLPALLERVRRVAPDASSSGADAPPELDVAGIARLVDAALPARIEDVLAPFLAGLRRRLERDRVRLQSYYLQLLDESSQRVGRARRSPDGGDAARKREEQRCTAIRRDHEAKLADLETKYALEVEVRPVQVLEVIAPVQRFRVRVLRRKASREIALDFFPFAARLEPPPCDDGFSSDRTRLACDEAVHLVSPRGLASCSRCQKPYCRACHTKACPRCRG
jgi:hypothetical protein